MSSPVWSNWAGNQTAMPKAILRPETGGSGSEGARRYTCSTALRLRVAARLWRIGAIARCSSGQQSSISKR